MKRIMSKNLQAIERVSFARREKERGITLVALIITIIVLIILAAVTIFAFTESGLMQTASKGTENYANAQEYEKQIMDNIDKKAKDVVKNITDITGGNGGGTGTPPTPEEPELPAGWDKDKVYAYKSKDNKVVPIPNGFAVSEIVGEQSVDTGLVIKITQEGVTSEFVWVPVANPSEMFEEVSEGVYRGKLYNSGTTPITYSEDGYREPDIVITYDGVNSSNSSYFKAAISETMTGNEFKTQLQNEFKAMKESVEKYNGFYIGRYETGNLSQEKAAVAKGNSDIGGQNWYVHYQKNKTVVEGKSSMIWGCQWDAVMKWFLSSTDADTRTYVTNSTGKGNYSGTQEGGNRLIPTGSNDDYSVNNIYDMAGNAYDWTCEAYSTYGRVDRRWRL